MLVPISDLVIFERLILWQHPQTRTNHLDILLLLYQQRKLAFFCHKSNTGCSNYVSSSIRRLLVRLMRHSYLQF